MILVDLRKKKILEKPTSNAKISYLIIFVLSSLFVFSITLVRICTSYCSLKNNKLCKHLEVLKYDRFFFFFLSFSFHTFTSMLSNQTVHSIQKYIYSLPCSITSNVQRCSTVAKLSGRQIHTFMHFKRRACKRTLMLFSIQKKKRCTDSFPTIAVKTMLLSFTNINTNRLESFHLFYTSLALEIINTIHWAL